MSFNVSYIYEIKDRYSRYLDNITKKTNAYTASTKKAMLQAKMLGDKLKQTGRKMKDVGGSLMTKLTLPIQALGIASMWTSVRMEDAFTGVRKTVNATEPQFKKMREQFEKMSTEIPVSTETLYGLAESAGQLNIQFKNIPKFTKTMAMLGVTTNMVAEEGAMQLAKFAGILGMNQEKFDRLGSVIVHLGNKTATTERDIVSMALGMAGAAKTVGMLESQVMALAATTSAIGMESQAGATAYSRILLSMGDAASSGGKKLAKFAKVAGMSSKKFATTFKDDAAKGLLVFIQGLQRLKKEKVNVNAVLKSLQFNEVRVKKALLGTMLAGDLLKNSLQLGNAAWEENNALIKEAELRFKTSGSQIKILWNRVKLIAKTIGDLLVPVFIKVSKKILPLIEKFKSMSKKSKILTLVIAGVTAALPPLIMFLGVMAASIGALLPAIAALGGVLGPIIIPIGLIVGSLGYLIYKLVTTKERMSPVIESLRDLGRIARRETEAISNLFGAFDKGSGSLDTVTPFLNILNETMLATIQIMKTLTIISSTFLKNLMVGPRMLGAIFKGRFGDAFKMMTENFSQTMEGYKEIGAIVGGDSMESNRNKLGDGLQSSHKQETQKVEINGEIAVSAAQGSKVESASMDNNLGTNAVLSF